MTRPFEASEALGGLPARRWHEIDARFVEALDVPADVRPDWLDARCGDDRELRDAVRALLEAQASCGGFLDGASSGGPVADFLAAALEERDEAADPRIGKRVGAFRIRSRIGRGGMADVYLGEREEGEFSQRVAVKIQRRGLDDETRLRRFRIEREILSDLDHPNIARLIDGGATEDGLPYLVMEYVEGEPISTYCERRRLPVRDRLALFIEVARAVQAAHARLVVHRDIKPSNILVTPEGRVKLLDFGIAKLLDPTTLPGDAPRTRTGFRPLTPEYASPEQVQGSAITTASDVYQLGLVLYRLLTGGRPFDDCGGNRRALEDAITETRPSRPSQHVGRQGAAPGFALQPAALSRRLRGDLDTIVLTALRKEPERRYASAFEMGEDVRRHLEGRPISAREDARVYRLRKFLQRNAWVGPAAVLALTSLGLYVATLISHGRQLEVERNAARLEAERARTSQEFLVELFRSADPLGPLPTGRRNMLVSEVMEEGVRRARTELAGQPELQVTLLGTIGDVFLGLGDAPRSLEVHRIAHEVARERFGTGSAEAARALRGLVGPNMHVERLGSGKVPESQQLALAALDGARRAFGPGHVESLRAEAELGSILNLNNRHAVAAALLAHALDGFADHPAATPQDEILALRYVLAPVERLDSFRGRPGTEAARAYAERLVGLAEATYGPAHARTADVRVVASFSFEREEARRQRRLGIPVLREQLGEEHDFLARAYMVHAGDLNVEGAFDSAAVNYRKAADVWIRSGRNELWASMALDALGEVLLRGGRTREAADPYREAVEVLRGVPPDVLAPEVAARRIAFLELAAGWAEYRAGGRAAHLLPLAERILADPDGRGWPGRAECAAALALRDLGRHAEAERMASAGLAKSPIGDEPDPALATVAPCAALAGSRSAALASSP